MKHRIIKSMLFFMVTVNESKAIHILWYPFIFKTHKKLMIQICDFLSGSGVYDLHNDTTKYGKLNAN